MPWPLCTDANVPNKWVFLFVSLHSLLRDDLPDGVLLLAMAMGPAKQGEAKAWLGGIVAIYA